MKKLFVMTCLFLFSFPAFAGDNGSFVSCLSNSGRTAMVFGHILSLANAETVQLSIDNQSLGVLEVDNSVFKKPIDEETIQFLEADGSQTDILTIRILSPKRIDILSGIDPRTNEALTHQIKLNCKTVYNPI